MAGTGRYISGTDSLTSIFHIHTYLAYFKFFFLFKRGFYAVISFNGYITVIDELHGKFFSNFSSFHKNISMHSVHENVKIMVSCALYGISNLVLYVWSGTMSGV